jgi:hypothetical protein
MRWDVALSGTYRRENDKLNETFARLMDFHFNIISPTNVTIARTEDHFVYMGGETRFTPEYLEWTHLAAINKSGFVWLFAPHGYVGYTALAEVGYAVSVGKQVFTDSASIPSFLRCGAVNIVGGVKDMLPLHAEDSLNSREWPRMAGKFRELALNRDHEDYDLIKGMIMFMQGLTRKY